MNQKISPHLHLAKSYWTEHLQPGDIAIDATCGNGHDTLFLCQHLLKHEGSLVAGLDIQSAAILNTDALLKQSLPQEHLKRVLLHRMCHGKIHQIPLPQPPRLIVYNLGYLPGGDKSMTTQTGSTLKSFEQSLDIVARDGAISITCYPGHEEGEREESALLSFVANLPSSRWQVCYHKWPNRAKSPTLLWIESATGEK
jgi:putative rRNA methylase